MSSGEPSCHHGGGSTARTSTRCSSGNAPGPDILEEHARQIGTDCDSASRNRCDPCRRFARFGGNGCPGSAFAYPETVPEPQTEQV